MTDEEPKRLLAAAREALQNSHAPYSNFRVGAAALTKDRRIFSGANIENASYGLTICAERTAIFHALMNGASKIDKIAVTTEQKPLSLGEGMPCGACRQVMAEFMDLDAEVIVDQVGTFTLKDLLPHPFILK